MKKGYMCEAAGSGIIILAGLVSCIFGNDSLGIYGIAAVFAISWTVCYYIFRNFCECHFNIAISLGALISGKISIGRFFGNAFFQLLGGVIAGAIITAILCLTQEGINNLQACINGFSSYSKLSIEMGGMFALEICGTAILVLAFLVFTSKKYISACSGLFIGAIYFVLVLLGGNLTGGCFNPVRALIPSILVAGTGQFDILLEAFPFIAATLVGGVVAAPVYKLLGKLAK